MPVSHLFHLFETSPSQSESSSSGTENVSGAADYVANQKAPEDIHPEAFSRYQRDLVEAFSLDGACEATLEAGESILVPEGWFHSAEGGSGPGIGVGAWFR